MREHKVDNYIGGAGKWEERSGAHHVFLRLQPRKAGQSWWVAIKVAANAEVVAVVEDTYIIISSFIKVTDISPSITIMVAILAVSEKPNALSAMAHLNNIRIVAGRNFAEQIPQSIEQILAKQEGNCCSQHRRQPCGRRFFRPGCKKA